MQESTWTCVGQIDHKIWKCVHYFTNCPAILFLGLFRCNPKRRNSKDTITKHQVPLNILPQGTIALQRGTNDYQFMLASMSAKNAS
jgi:hypothetical protein